ncbi:MAG: hypothetical protein ACFE75_06400 [Candidatus Hodarchaeota archaeon]
MRNKKFVVKFQAVLDKYFHRIFNNSHVMYTIIFLISSLLIGILSFIPNPSVGNGILFLATVISSSFILLMFEGLIPQLDKYLFSSEKKFDRSKIICFTINFFINFFIILTYFLAAPSTQITIEFLGWDVILPTFFVIIYFSWNLVQIFFIRVGFEDISINIENRVVDKYGFSKKKEFVCFILLIIALIIPVLMLLGTFFGLLPYFDPLSLGVYEPLIWYFGSHLIILIILIITSWRLITLHQRSRKNKTTNAFAPMFYIFIWIVLWFRSFSFLISLRGIIQPSTEMEIFSRFIDILLMIFTAIMVLRSLGGKVYESMLFNQNNMPFFLFAFTILYIEGQIIMITGAGNLAGIFSDRNQINLINNFLIIVITVIFYWWYSEHSLERKGFIVKKRYYPEDVALIVNDFKEFLVDNNALDTNKVDKEKFQNFLYSKNLLTPEVIDLKEEAEIENKFDYKNNQELSEEQIQDDR